MASAGRNSRVIPGELFDAAQGHLAHHPEPLGAVGLDVVQQMVGERRGQSTPEAGGGHTAARQR
jgi:hypothetical protein